jgi:hypothetical protein
MFNIASIITFGLIVFYLQLIVLLTVEYLVYLFCILLYIFQCAL